MARVAARIPDRRVLRLIRSYLTAGALNNGLFEISQEGTPQGGPLSPLLLNYLNPLLRGWARVFRLQSVARGGIAGRLDTATSTLRCLSPVEDAGQSLSRTLSPEGH